MAAAVGAVAERAVAAVASGGALDSAAVEVVAEVAAVVEVVAKVVVVVVAVAAVVVLHVLR